MRGLSRADVRARARDLYRVGWSLSSIAEAFDPPKARTSVRSWLTTSHPSLEHPLPSPAASSSSTIDTAESCTTQPEPQPSAPARTPRDYRQVNSAASVISSSERSRVAELAPLARRYRAGTPRLGPLGVANDELTALARELYDRGAPVRELAEAAGVTYRAMARRLGR